MRDIWQKLCEKDERLRVDGSRVEFESQNLKRLLEQVYEQGVKQGKIIESNRTPVQSQSPPFDPFRGLFK